MEQTKMCPNGHVMDATWDRCPYCPASAPPRVPVPPTIVREAAPPGFGLAAVPRPPVPAAARRTVDRAAEVAKEKQAPIVGWLLVLTGKRKGEDFRIREGKNVVGSDPGCDIVIDDPYVSGKHATISDVM